MTSYPINDKIATYQALAANQLVEAYENDQLKGKLKEIAAELNDESNPVIMLMKYKK
jgi:outer membrane PBP1 activator LpoA protein